ncbi:MAG: type I 3-dehydroquinate dehydratase [Candidatus Omnitrophica bacterium]|nr:type I 3-dehydroquinate dehydratase [Candidatus Omnitrophota bacterium]
MMTRTHFSLICTPLTMPSHEAMKQAMVAENPLQDVYELRLDYLESVHLPSLLEKHNLPVLATLRLPQDGASGKAQKPNGFDCLNRPMTWVPIISTLKSTGLEPSMPGEKPK